MVLVLDNCFLRNRVAVVDCVLVQLEVLAEVVPPVVVGGQLNLRLEAASRKGAVVRVYKSLIFMKR